MEISRRPQKQLLFYWLDEIFKRSSGKFDGLDFACGTMNFRPYFRTQKYTGVDIDEGRVALGKSKFPEVEGHICSIEDFPSDQKADFVTCIQTIGSNTKFKAENTVLCVEKLCAATRAGGDLVFNLGPLVREHHDAAVSAARQHFKDIEIRHYGAFNKEINLTLSKMLATAMYFIPPLRTAGPEDRLLLVCKGKV